MKRCDKHSQRTDAHRRTPPCPHRGLELGRGVPCDTVLAGVWYQRSAAGGHAGAATKAQALKDGRADRADRGGREDSDS